jgi:hypothetical protein
MQALLTIFMILVVFAIVAGRFGHDSRDGFGPSGRPRI